MTTANLFYGDSLDAYNTWESPTTIISDGAYGIGGFDGDPKQTNDLVEWYTPHIKEWSKAATNQTSLWFWNTEVGWATCHNILLENNWQYVQLITWDKGIGHVAGNVNGSTIRRFPVATEVTALYVRPQEIVLNDNHTITIQNWLRTEWKRAGLTLNEANKACGVKNAASRKWLTNDSMWYMPPTEMFLLLQEYANRNGKPTGKPYFDLPSDMDTAKKWSRLRSKWNHQHGYTNVWQTSPLKNAERVKDNQGKYLHTNQKPIELMKRQILATSDEEDVIWEPFGGLCSASVAAKELNRVFYAAETNRTFYEAAQQRLGLN